MKKARMLGSYAGHLAKQRGNSVSHLSQLLSCTETQVQAFFKGRAFPSYNQLSALAKALGTTPKRLIAGDEQSYNETVVHCDGKLDFQLCDPIALKATFGAFVSTGYLNCERGV